MSPPPQRPRLADRLLVAACLLGTAFLLLQILTYGYGRDQGIYAMVGRALLRLDLRTDLAGWLRSVRLVRS